MVKIQETVEKIAKRRTKKKEKAEVDKIGKDATGREAKSLFGLAMIQKEFSSSRESRDRFIIHLGLHFQC